MMTQETERALCDAGYMSVKEYLQLCEKNGWGKKQLEFGPEVGTQVADEAK